MFPLGGAGGRWLGGAGAREIAMAGAAAAPAGCGAALWPVPPCWNAACGGANASCACTAPWTANRFEVDGARLCVIHPGVLDALYAVALGALALQLAVWVAAERLELRRGGRYKLKARLPFIGKLVIILGMVVLLLRCLIYDAAMFFDRTTTALAFFFVFVCDAFTSYNTYVFVSGASKGSTLLDAQTDRSVCYATRANAPARTAHAQAEVARGNAKSELGSEMMSKFPALSTLDPRALAIKLACLNILVLAVACATLSPSVPLSMALRLFYAADLIACVGGVGAFERAILPLADMYSELLATSLLYVEGSELD